MGSFSHFIPYILEKESDEVVFLKEAFEYINSKFPKFSNHLVDDDTSLYYSLVMMLDVLEMISLNFDVDLIKPFCEMLVFDAFIGNSDRHPWNWGTISVISKKTLLDAIKRSTVLEKNKVEITYEEHEQDRNILDISEALWESFLDDCHSLKLSDSSDLGNGADHIVNRIIKRDHFVRRSYKLSFCPLYDNGSSLCSYVNESAIDSYLRDMQRFNALCDSKSLSIMSIDGNPKRSCRRHLMLVAALARHDNSAVRDSTGKVLSRLFNTMNETTIDVILSCYPHDILSEKKKKLIKRFLTTKAEYLYKIWGDSYVR